MPTQPRPLYNDTSCAYNSRGQLVSESYGPAGSMTNLSYGFDAAGLGVRAQVQTNASPYWQLTDANTAWPARQEWQVGAALHNYPAMGTAPGADSLSATLDSNAVTDLYYDATDLEGHWLAFLTLNPGSHTLSVNAFTNSVLAGAATNTFTSLGTAQTASTTWDARGYAVKRTLVSNGSQQQQTLTWDGAGRLTAVSQRDLTSNNGYEWTALYDGLGRRLRTVYVPVDGGVACPKLSVTQESWYDPQVEFLEIGVAVNGQKSWKMIGPDLNGVYGGLQGIGGLEAIIKQSDGAVTPVINDAFGNVVASVSGTNVTWNSTRVGGYGPLPENSAKPLSPNVSLAEATVWRSKRTDPTGYVWLGARYYHPNGGRFLSPDPLGHPASMDLYSYADGDPINFMDPDGRGKTGVKSGDNFSGYNPYGRPGFPIPPYVNTGDPTVYGSDWKTFGPVSFPIPGTSRPEPQACVDGTAAHEAQHRSDFWNGNVFRLPLWQIEQRGFAAGIPVLEAALTNPNLSASDVQRIQDYLDVSKLISTDESSARYYANDPVPVKWTPAVIDTLWQ